MKSSIQQHKNSNNNIAGEEELGLQTDIYERRLPVYLLVDCSSTMRGEPITAMEMGLHALLGDLQQDPQAMETVWLSILTFGSSANVLIPLTDIEDFYLPPLVAEGTTALGASLHLLMQQVNDEVRKSSASQKGDWRPLVFLFTDGKPTDDWEDAVKELNKLNSLTLIACGAGPEAAMDVLEKISAHIVRLDDTSPGKLASFLQWVSMTITAAGKSVGTGKSITEIIPPPTQGIAVQ
ncbi:MAG: VWA domain-containing protein [Verrucomicrobiae bacterium]|nr:VWA domain-containing protein [Verrucomicrobiae bacterium]